MQASIETTDKASTADPKLADGMAAWEQVYAVLISPRCINCHTATNYPQQGDDRHRHFANVIRGPAGKGVPGLNCVSCHQSVNVDPSTPLLWVLREELKMTGTKYGCGISACGACTVHLDGIATRSCVVPVSLIGDRPIVTIEGVGTDAVGRAVQEAWIEKDVVQCGYCQSGQIMSAVALLKATAKPTDTNIEESMGGNLCRCATYVRIREAIKGAAEGI